MSRHSCSWCRGDTSHVMMRIHTKEDDNCCYCKPYSAIDILPEPYISIAKIIKEYWDNDDKDDCCYFNIESILDQVISMGLRSKNKDHK